MAPPICPQCRQPADPVFVRCHAPAVDLAGDRFMDRRTQPNPHYESELKAWTEWSGRPDRDTHTPPPKPRPTVIAEMVPSFEYIGLIVCGSCRVVLGATGATVDELSEYASGLCRAADPGGPNPQGSLPLPLRR